MVGVGFVILAVVLNLPKGVYGLPERVTDNGGNGGGVGIEDRFSLDRSILSRLVFGVEKFSEGEEEILGKGEPTCKASQTRLDHFDKGGDKFY